VADTFHWRTHAGTELDLILTRRGKRYGLELKCTDAPQMTKSLCTALDDLGLERARVVYPGTEHYRTQARVEMLPLGKLSSVFRVVRQGC
jgi:hypothetical protein